MGTWAKAQQSDSPKESHEIIIPKVGGTTESQWVLGCWCSPVLWKSVGAGQTLRDQRVSRLLVRVGIIGGGIWREPKRPALSKSLFYWPEIPLLKHYFVFCFCFCFFWEGYGGSIWRTFDSHVKYKLALRGWQKLSSPDHLPHYRYYLVLYIHCLALSFVCYY